MDSSESSPEHSLNGTPESAPLQVRILKAITIVLLGILAAGILCVLTVVGGMFGMELGVPRGDDGVWKLVVFPALCVLGLGWGLLCALGILVAYPRIGAKWCVVAFITLAAGGGLFWFVLGFAFGSSSR
jgi:hypothetical protein